MTFPSPLLRGLRALILDRLSRFAVLTQHASDADLAYLAGLMTDDDAALTLGQLQRVREAIERRSSQDGPPLDE